MSPLFLPQLRRPYSGICPSCGKRATRRSWETIAGARAATVAHLHRAHHLTESEAVTLLKDSRVTWLEERTYAPAIIRATREILGG